MPELGTLCENCNSPLFIIGGHQGCLYCNGYGAGKNVMQVDFCKVCKNVMPSQYPTCMYCQGKRDADKDWEEAERQEIAERPPQCPHPSFSAGKERDHCLKCGLYMDLIHDPLRTSTDTPPSVQEPKP